VDRGSTLVGRKELTQNRSVDESPTKERRKYYLQKGRKSVKDVEEEFCVKTMKC